MSLRVLLVDDQALVRAGIRMILAPEHDIEVVDEAEDGAAAVEAVARASVEVVVMDVRMPRMDGLEATRLILDRPDPPAVLVLTTFDLDEYVYAALRAGAAGFLLKDAPEDQIVHAIRTVAAGVSLLSPAVTRRLVEHRAAIDPERRELVTRLTDRETEILSLLARGQSNREIARGLVLSEATVKTHVGRVLHKLGLQSRAQAVVLAYEAGVVSVGDP